MSEVIARIQVGAEFSFDFLLLLVLAGIIAFMGLMESSSVVLVASMLVSPLMGPILAGIFGGAVHDSRLSWCGVRHEVHRRKNLKTSSHSVHTVAQRNLASTNIS